MENNFRIKKRNSFFEKIIIIRFVNVEIDPRLWYKLAWVG
jgi:hypothetical protein